MREDIKTRVKVIANYVFDNKVTIREASKIFSISKSSVHIDLSKRLKVLDFELYKKVQKVLEFNFEDKCFRGGKATKNKYSKNKK